MNGGHLNVFINAVKHMNYANCEKNNKCYRAERECNSDYRMSINQLRQFVYAPEVSKQQVGYDGSLWRRYL